MLEQVCISADSWARYRMRDPTLLTMTDGCQCYSPKCQIFASYGSCRVAVLRVDQQVGPLDLADLCDGVIFLLDINSFKPPATKYLLSDDVGLTLKIP